MWDHRKQWLCFFIVLLVVFFTAVFPFGVVHFEASRRSVSPRVGSGSIGQGRPVGALAAPDCDCYITNGPNPGYFQNYRFLDFRNRVGAGGPDISEMPPSVSSSQNSGNEPVTESILADPQFQNQWSILTWTQPSAPKNPILLVNSAQNVFYYNNPHLSPNSILVLRTTRNEEFQSAAEIQLINPKIKYTTLRARARVLPQSKTGACAGVFTFGNSSRSPRIGRLEADMDILTRDPDTTVRISNQPHFSKTIGEEVAGASTQVAISSWRQWFVYRLDRFGDVSRHYHNGQHILDKMPAVPDAASCFRMNIWSDGGLQSGTMSVGDEAYLAVEWLVMAYNATDDAPAKETCEKMCKIDETMVVGVPERFDPSSSLTATSNNTNYQAIPSFTSAPMSQTPDEQEGELDL